MLDTGIENEKWADQLIASLIDQRVDYFCISPGSRSAPLALAIAKNKNAKSMIHFDERGMAFHALGYAKASGRPAALLVTSGSAVVNLFPALMEASYSRIPMIVLTADRPPELRDCGANQTADQVNIFGNYVRWFVDLPCPSPHFSENYIGSTISHAVLCALSTPQGPVHLNCMFREPLFSDQTMESIELKTPRTFPFEFTLSEETLATWGQELSQFKKGIILIGTLSNFYSHHALYTLAKKLGWPIFADVLSNFRTQAHQEDVMCNYYDLILKSLPDLDVEALLYFGDYLVSKTLLTWISTKKPKKVFRVVEHLQRIDSSHLVTDRLFSSPDHFCKGVLPYVEEHEDSWRCQWAEYGRIIENCLETCTSQTEISEPGLIQILKRTVREDLGFFFANSMPIRDADLFFFPKQTVGPIFGSRGSSGIDGNIATSIGICEALQKPLIAVIGDLAFLHDLNSLAQLMDKKTPLILIVINNGGGAIFSFLPIAKKTHHVERFFACAHQFSFEHIAKQFALDYHQPRERDELEELLEEKITSTKGSCLIEIVTDRQENVRLHQDIYNQVKKALHSSTVLPV